MFRLIPRRSDIDVMVKPRSAIFPRTLGTSIDTIPIYSPSFVLRKFVITYQCRSVNTFCESFFSKRKIFLAFYIVRCYSRFIKMGV